jgi:hypothetical protein
MPTINFSDVQDLTPVPQGTYEATIVHSQEGNSKAGYPKIDIRWKIEGGEFEGRQVFDTLSFHPDAQWRTKIALRSLGFPNDFDGDVEAEDLINLSAKIVVGIEDSGGTDESGEPYPVRNRVMKVKPLGTSAKSLLE